jgi:hypothetical protein
MGNSFKDPQSMKYMLFAFGIQNIKDQSKVKLQNLLERFFVTADYIERIKKEDGTIGLGKSKRFDLIPFNMRKQFIPEPILESLDIENLICFETDENYKIQGEFEADIFEYIRISFYPCDYYQNHYYKDCLIYSTGDATINNSFFLELYYQEYSYNKNIIGSKHIPVNFMIRKEYYANDNSFINGINIFISQDTLESVEDVFLGIGNKVVFYQPRFFNIENTVTNFDGAYFKFYLVQTKSYSFYLRTYRTLLDAFTFLGGIIQVIFLLLFLIITPIANRNLIIKIASKIFNIIDKEKYNEIEKNENYNKYDDLINRGEKLPIVKNLNKSKLETMMSINLYKYEINKGVSKSTGILLFDYFTSQLLCCCKKEKEKEKALEDNPNQEAEDVFASAEDQINKMIKGRSIIKFFNEVDVIKNTIFKDNKKLIEFSQSRVIYEENLLKIIQELDSAQNNPDCFDSNEMALEKNNNLILGLRSLKIKPTLHKKFDLNLLNLIEFYSENDIKEKYKDPEAKQPDYLKFYMVNHYNSIKKSRKSLMNNYWKLRLLIYN